jgi:hypothetical protein
MCGMTFFTFNTNPLFNVYVKTKMIKLIHTSCTLSSYQESLRGFGTHNQPTTFSRQPPRQHQGDHLVTGQQQPTTLPPPS